MAEKVEITFLGTGSAVPTKRRNHPAVLLKYKDENILFDCGEGTQRQFRIAGLNPCKITKICITHWHGDHVLGLPGLIQTMMLNGYNKTLKIYGPKGTKRMMRAYLDFFAGRKNDFLVEVYEVDNEFFDNGDFSLMAEKSDHDTPALAYSFVIKDKMRMDKKKLQKLKLPNGPHLADLQKGKTVSVNGKKINGKNLLYEEKGRKVSLIMDTRKTKDLVKFAKDSDLLICESTYADEEKELADDHAHLTSVQAAEIAKEAKVEKLILTHLSQRYEFGKGTKIIVDEAKKVFKNVEVAEDFLGVEL